MTVIQAQNELNLLRGCLNRMFLTDNAKELQVLHDSAKDRLERLYIHHHERVDGLSRSE